MHLRFSFCLVLFAAARLTAQDMPLSQVLLDDANWELVGDGYKFTEGPAVDAQGNVFFTDVGASRIYKASVNGKVTIFAKDTARTNGLMFGPHGRLFGCRNGEKKIVAYDRDGSMSTIATEVNSNDIVVGKDGGVYFTDPPNQQVWYISPQGEKRVVAKGFRPNGIIMWLNEGTLVVTDSEQPHLWTFRIEPNGDLSFRERYYMPLQMPTVPQGDHAIRQKSPLSGLR